MRRWLHTLIAALVALVLLAGGSVGPVRAAQTEDPVVHGVLYYSPSCGHCHYVITEVLPPLLEQYGDQLVIIGIDVTGEGGAILYHAAVERFNIPEERLGVPCLVIGETVMVGSTEIPEQLPGLIEQGLAAGGVDWPDIPGLAEAMAAQPAQATGEGAEGEAATTAEPAAENGAEAAEPTAVEAAAAATPDSAEPSDLTDISGAEDIEAESLQSRFNRDPIANSISVIVLGAMIGVAAVIVVRSLRPSKRSRSSRNAVTGWVVPLLAIVGLVVAGYLAYVELTQVEAVCGPVGDCNTVQQSAYARLFGVLPIGVLGLVGYVAILIAWAVARWGNGRVAQQATLALFAMTFGGLLFSIYLTFLEPFVIGATCAWCLTSAVIMTLLAIVTAPAGIAALPRQQAASA
jgi:uncharacterized membrane protein